jgi:hypothetical protein
MELKWMKSLRIKRFLNDILWAATKVYFIYTKTVSAEAKLHFHLSAYEFVTFLDAHFQRSLYYLPHSSHLTAFLQSLQYCTIRYSKVQWSTLMYITCSAVQYSTVQYSTVRYSTIRYGRLQYGTVQYSTVQYSTVRYGFGMVRPADTNAHISTQHKNTHH